MTFDTLLGLVLGIPVGLISGLYTGVITSRYVRFAELRTEVLRNIRTIDFMQEEAFIRISGANDLPKLHLVASDLLFLGHRKAGESVLSLLREIVETNYTASAGRMIVEEYGTLYSSWQDTARMLPANKWALWSFWGRL
jgi:hypothetical protein